MRIQRTIGILAAVAALCVGGALAAGPHGKWAEDPASPSARCTTCHGTHDVLSSGDPVSPSWVRYLWTAWAQQYERRPRRACHHPIDRWLLTAS